jgi:hypothetical protein
MEADTNLQSWKRATQNDATDLAYERLNACQIYALAQLSDPAIDCLRRGLSEPSLVTPLLVRHHPLFDGLRDHPEFQSLLSD